MFEAPKFVDRRAQGRNTVRRRYGVGPAPFEEGLRGGHDQVLDCGVAAEVGLFVDSMAVEIENPGFDVPFRNQMNNSLFGGSRRQSFGGKAVFELTRATSPVSASMATTSEV